MSEKIWLGKGENALKKLISPSNGSTSVVGNHILVDRQIVTFHYEHAIMIVNEAETYDEVAGVNVSRPTYKMYVSEY